ncbi:hypothetical protein ABZ949_21020 [Micromonospora tulbaghiae]|uniref:hypothetical protein n=1 Tax=Micromonospora tulbaghiae TaxID=479978 RepID=UPI00340691C4
MAAGGDSGEVWRVYGAGGELLGEVEVEEHDMPCHRGRFRPQPAFEQLRQLFDEWNRAVDSGDPEPIDQAYEAIRAAVTMTCPDGRQVPEFVLGVEGDPAGFRWHDEPFGDDLLASGSPNTELDGPSMGTRPDCGRPSWAASDQAEQESP